MSAFGIRFPVKIDTVYEYVIERFTQAGLLPEFEGIAHSVEKKTAFDRYRDRIYNEAKGNPRSIPDDDKSLYCEEVFTEHLPMKFSFYICDGFFYYGFLSTDHDTSIEVSADDFVELSAMKIALKKFNSDVTFGFFTFRV